ncbi:hypothetical protein APB26_11100 [Pseudomonas aeruginosa]|nr:hypothetical protein APB26_11100 [Pseudomonas aeruginosa]OTI25578.1 hypothetical protein CAY89_02780 [Pseudomonas aeruginosa]OTI42364.1 hypothetical protein CAZ18_23160 [Pseudomonas aeruginosa]OTI43115.1 hypothetical protein CAY97_02750 [Pseudomonas aeruginosa]QFZ02778.1 hypothetical protein CPZ93_31015 [Pseudomonas aeruginosa]
MLGDCCICPDNSLTSWTKNFSQRFEFGFSLGILQARISPYQYVIQNEIGYINFCHLGSSYDLTW